MLADEFGIAAEAASANPKRKPGPDAIPEYASNG